jgi:hypothetical protein
MKKIDRRVQKTNAALQQAFRQLARTTDYRNITVKKLTETAKINRKTFYLHYDSIDDFADTIADTAADELLDIITAKPLREALSQPGYIFDNVFDFFDQSREFYIFMMTSIGYTFQARKVETKVTDGFAAAIEKQFNLSKLDAYTCASFLIRNTLMMFQLYNNGKLNFDRKEFRDRVVRLNGSGLSSFFDLK